MYYGFIHKLPGVTLHASDTDSYMVSARAQSEEELVEKMMPIMDMCTERRDHPLFNEERKKIPGFLKTEFDLSQRIYEGVFLRSKLYSLKVRVLLVISLRCLKAVADRAQGERQRVHQHLQGKRHWEVRAQGPEIPVLQGDAVWRRAGSNQRARHSIV